MKNYRHYSKNRAGKTVPVVISLVVLIGMIVLNLAVPEPVLEPDVTYPMTNARISWLESYHFGSWGDAE